jgi:DNA-binding CsgD family transcriptional regulator
MTRQHDRANASRGASAQSDLGGHLKCDRQAEEMLRAFFGAEASNGVPLPPELRGLAEGAQRGPPGVRRALIIQQGGERLQVEVTAVGRGRTQLRLWRELLDSPLGVTQGLAKTSAPSTADLTQREREVALLVADGLRSSEVAVRLGIAPQTVKSHLKAIFEKLAVRNRVELSRLLGQR